MTINILRGRYRVAKGLAVKRFTKLGTILSNSIQMVARANANIIASIQTTKSVNCEL